MNFIYSIKLCIYLLPRYLPDLLKLQVALTTLDTTNGNIILFVKLINISPGNFIYIIFRWDHGCGVQYFKTNPNIIPPLTPKNVAIISLCFITCNGVSLERTLNLLFHMIRWVNITLRAYMFLQ